jgi:hypothetical protein
MMNRWAAAPQAKAGRGAIRMMTRASATTAVGLLMLFMRSRPIDASQAWR